MILAAVLCLNNALISWMVSVRRRVFRVKLRENNKIFPAFRFFGQRHPSYLSLKKNLVRRVCIFLAACCSSQSQPLADLDRLSYMILVRRKFSNQGQEEVVKSLVATLSCAISDKPSPHFFTQGNHNAYGSNSLCNLTGGKNEPPCLRLRWSGYCRRSSDLIGIIHEHIEAFFILTEELLQQSQTSIQWQWLLSQGKLKIDLP